jgi:hypothetical protein
MVGLGIGFCYFHFKFLNFCADTFKCFVVFDFIFRTVKDLKELIIDNGLDIFFGDRGSIFGDFFHDCINFSG